MGDNATTASGAAGENTRTRRARAGHRSRAIAEVGIIPCNLRPLQSAALAICGVLERATAEELVSAYYLKGGAAMELRFAQRARATKDLRFLAIRASISLAGRNTPGLRGDPVALGEGSATRRMAARRRVGDAAPSDAYHSY